MNLICHNDVHYVSSYFLLKFFTENQIMRDYSGLNQHMFSIKLVRRCSRDVLIHVL